MNTIKKLTAAVALAFAVVSPATAATFQDNAIDKTGHPIMDARGGCVYTKWETGSNNCGKRRLTLTREERTVYFDFNKSTIKASERAKLDNLVKAVKGAKEVESVDIVGHADQIGGNAYNSTLSRKRAEAVKGYLGKKGVRTRKVDLRAVGESQPVTKCDPSLPRAQLIACLAEDRRVEIELNIAK